MHNVLYILYDGLTDPLGQSQVLPYLKGLSKNGYHFTVISCDKSDRYNQFKDEILASIEGYSIEWHSLVYHKSPPVLSTIYDIRNLTRKAYYLHAEKKFDAVHCRSYIPAMVGMWMKQQFGVKFIFDMRGFWADERVDGKIWKLGNPLYKFIYTFFKKKEKQFVETADHTISLTHAAKRIIHEWDEVPGQPVPIEVIPCCVDTERFSSASIDAAKQTVFRKKHNIQPTDLILSYLGSIGTWYMLNEMLDCFKAIKEHKPTARFLFLTNEDPGMIRSAAAERGIDAASLIFDKAPFSDVPSLISVSDASIFFILPAFSKKASSPVKHGELMSLGIPVICNSNVGDLDEIVEATGTGIFIDEFTSEGYRQCAAQIDQLLQIDKAKIRSEAIRLYGLKSGVAGYLKVYDSLMKNQLEVVS